MASSSLLLCLLFLSAAVAAAAGAVVNPRRSLAAQTAKSDMASLAAGSPMVAGLMNERLKALTTSFAQQMGREFHYCIKNM
jgi:RsiW-degrading membrane proteinase PrsW (M82 family)